MPPSIAPPPTKPSKTSFYKRVKVSIQPSPSNSTPNLSRPTWPHCCQSLIPPTSNKLHIRVEPISKVYTDNTGHSPIRSLSVNQYIMIAYHFDSNTILQAPFKTKHNRHCITTARNTSVSSKKNCTLLTNLCPSTPTTMRHLHLQRPLSCHLLRRFRCLPQLSMESPPPLDRTHAEFSPKVNNQSTHL